MPLNSNRLLYEKIKSSDADIYLPMAMNAEVMKHITGKALSAPESIERLQNMVGENKKFPKLGFYKVYEKGSRCFIGLGKLVWINEKTAELGYSLLPEYWGKRYASEIAGFLITYAKGCGIEELIAVVSPGNIASKKLLSSFQFTWSETGFLNELVTEIHKLKLVK